MASMAVSLSERGQGLASGLMRVGGHLSLLPSAPPNRPRPPRVTRPQSIRRWRGSSSTWRFTCTTTMSQE